MCEDNMLKDLFKTNKANKEKEKILLNLMDGYVDVKAYKHKDDGSKELIYHNTGDNTVTNWMRHTLMMLLSGYSYSNNGSGEISNGASGASKQQLSTPTVGEANHSEVFNNDGYVLNGEQYLWEWETFQGHPILPNSKFYKTDKQFPYFPTKILLGTGCEYVDWDSLKENNEAANSTWYTNMVTQYGDGDEDKAYTNFNNLVGINDEGADISGYDCNVYSATIGAQGVYTGTGSMLRAVTVNDPDTTTNVSSSSEMANRYGVTGAIKTLYLPKDGFECGDLLQPTISDSGRLLKGYYRGAGRPCFIYFNRTEQESGDELDWDKQTSDIYISKDAASTYLHRVTFKVVIPAQSSGTGAVGVYNPFNGYTFKQLGLFNDAVFSTDSRPGVNAAGAAYVKNNMPCGMMLGIKNIQSFTKTADESIEFTWTLTI